MKINVLVENLQKSLPFVFKAVSPRSHLPILQNFLLLAEKGKLLLSATDLEIGIQAEIPVNVEKEGSTTVSAKTLLELVNSLPAEKITIEEDGKNVKITSSKTKSTIQTTPQEEFPKLYEEKGEELLKLKQEDAQNLFSKVNFAASLDTGRPALSGILIKIDKDGILAVATDGYRLSVKQVNASTGAKEEKKVLVPARIIREVLSVKKEEDMGVYVSPEKNQVLFDMDEAVIVGRLISAEYPTYQKIIPSSFSTRFIFDREEMQKAVKLCAIFARESSNVVRFAIGKDKIVVSANTPSVGENTVEVEAKITGEENEIAFNVRYLLDLLGNVDEEEMVMEMTGPLSPGVFKVNNDQSFLHIIMPIRIQQES